MRVKSVQGVSVAKVMREIERKKCSTAALNSQTGPIQKTCAALISYLSLWLGGSCATAGASTPTTSENCPAD